MSIKDIWLKIKGSGEGAGETAGKLYVVALFLIFTTSAFALGRLSALESRRPAVKIELPQAAVAGRAQEAPTEVNLASQRAPVANTAAVGATAQGGEVVASKNGTKYHFSWCGSAKSIKPENRVTFPSEAAAKAAGYTLAKNCK